MPDWLRKEVREAIASESEAWKEQALLEVAAYFRIRGGWTSSHRRGKRYDGTEYPR